MKFDKQYVITFVLIGAFFTWAYVKDGMKSGKIISQLVSERNHLDSVISVSKDSVNKLKDIILIKDSHISVLDSQLNKRDVTIAETHKFYEKKYRSFDNAPLSRLDSFLLTAYPDSIPKRTNR